jgi:hypothetical protein
MLSVDKLWLHGSNNGFCDLVLDIENVIELSIIPLGPNVTVRGWIN